MNIQKKLFPEKDFLYVDIWYDENRNKANIYEDRDWFLAKIYYPAIEPSLVATGKRVIFNKHSFKDKNAVSILGTSQVKELCKFRAPDILLLINNQPVLAIETTDAVPTGNQPGKKIPILYKCSQLKIPSLIFLPLVRRRPPPHNSNAFCNPEVPMFAIRMTKKTGVPVHVVFSKSYTSYLKERLKPDDIKLITSFLKSEDFLQKYAVERIKLFMKGELLKLTAMDLGLMKISEDYINWRKPYLKGRQIVFGNKIVFRQDPDRGWSERGTGCLEAVESQVLELKTRIEKVEVWFPNLGKNFWYFTKRDSIRVHVLKKFADKIKFQNDLSKEEFMEIRELLEKHHSGKRKRAPLFVKNTDAPRRLRNSFVIFSNPEDWFNGIPQELQKIPSGAKIVLPRLVKDFWFFREQAWSNFVKRFNNVLYQEDLTPDEFKFLEKHFK